MVSVVEPMRVAAISASPRSRVRLSSRDAMSCCHARYAPPAAGTASLRGIRKFVAKPSATVFISPDLPSLSTSFVRMTFTRSSFLLVLRLSGAIEPAAKARLKPGLGNGIGRHADRAGDSSDGTAERAWQEPTNARDILIVRGARNAGFLELLGEQVLVEPVEEHLDRERGDDQVVELPEDRHLVRDDIA